MTVGEMQPDVSDVIADEDHGRAIRAQDPRHIGGQQLVLAHARGAGAGMLDVVETHDRRAVDLEAPGREDDFAADGDRPPVRRRGASAKYASVASFSFVAASGACPDGLKIV